MGTHCLARAQTAATARQPRSIHVTAPSPRPQVTVKKDEDGSTAAWKNDKDNSNAVLLVNRPRITETHTPKREGGALLHATVAAPHAPRKPHLPQAALARASPSPGGD